MSMLSQQNSSQHEIYVPFNTLCERLMPSNNKETKDQNICRLLTHFNETSSSRDNFWDVGSLPGDEHVIGVTATMQISIKCKSLPIQGQLDVINKVVATPSICHTKVAEELGISMST